MLYKGFGKSDNVITGFKAISLRTHNYTYSTAMKLLTGSKEVN